MGQSASINIVSLLPDYVIYLYLSKNHLYTCHVQ